MENTKETLTFRQRHLVTISAFTAKSDVARLKIALNEGTLVEADDLVVETE